MNNRYDQETVLLAGSVFCFETRVKVCTPSNMIKGNYSVGMKPQSGMIKPLLLAKVMAAGLLVVWLANSGWQLVKILAPSPQARTTDITAPAVVTPEQSAVFAVDVNTFKSIALFGEVATEVKAVEKTASVVETVAETQLNIVLKGVFFSHGGAIGRAIIANGNRDRLYSAGDTLDNLPDVSLSTVFPDRVKLNNRGNEEVLLLYPDGVRPTSTENISALIERSSFEDEHLRAMLAMEDDAIFGNQMVPVPRFGRVIRVASTRGRSGGLRILPGPDRDAFQRSGLRIDDVITAIDGQVLNDWRTAKQIYSNKRDATAVSLVILREGKEISLDIDFQAINR